jgi:hypothetical protein
MRKDAWQYGRDVRDGLIREYEHAYGYPAPAPALICDELITDFLGAILRFDPLPLDRYAETSWEGSQATVVINSLTADIPGVKDARGVENQTKLHETMHVVGDGDLAQQQGQAAFEGFLSAPVIRCYRETPRLRAGTEMREFWAEEAGRAAAVSFQALARSTAFNALIVEEKLDNGTAWRLLYEAAHDIGINASALVKQLGYEGYLTVETRGSRREIIRQPSLRLLGRRAA